MKRRGCESGAYVANVAGEYTHTHTHTHNSMTWIVSTYLAPTVAVTWRHVIVRCVRKIAKKQLLASSRLSVHMEQLGSNCMGFHEIWYLRILRKYFEKI